MQYFSVVCYPKIKQLSQNICLRRPQSAFLTFGTVTTPPPPTFQVYSWIFRFLYMQRTIKIVIEIKHLSELIFHHGQVREIVLRFPELVSNLFLQSAQTGSCYSPPPPPTVSYLMGNAVWLWNWTLIPSSTKIKNEWNYTSTPPRLHGAQGGNFTFTLPFQF
jgi:hypothetical protein